MRTLTDIASDLCAQDNACTAHPVFVVYDKRRIPSDQGEEFEWRDHEWDTADDEAMEAVLNDLHDLGQPTKIGTREFSRCHFVEVDVFRTACFTHAGCEDYLRQNGHNLCRPHIFVESGHRNDEWQVLRKHLEEIECP